MRSNKKKKKSESVAENAARAEREDRQRALAGAATVESLRQEYDLGMLAELTHPGRVHVHGFLQLAEASERIRGLLLRYNPILYPALRSAAKYLESLERVRRRVRERCEKQMHLVDEAAARGRFRQARHRLEDINDLVLNTDVMSCDYQEQFQERCKLVASRIKDPGPYGLGPREDLPEAAEPGPDPDSFRGIALEDLAVEEDTSLPWSTAASWRGLAYITPLLLLLVFGVVRRAWTSPGRITSGRVATLSSQLSNLDGVDFTRPPRSVLERLAARLEVDQVDTLFTIEWKSLRKESRFPVKMIKAARFLRRLDPLIHPADRTWWSPLYRALANDLEDTTVHWVSDVLAEMGPRQVAERRGIDFGIERLNAGLEVIRGAKIPRSVPFVASPIQSVLRTLERGRDVVSAVESALPGGRDPVHLVEEFRRDVWRSFTLEKLGLRREIVEVVDDEVATRVLSNVDRIQGTARRGGDPTRSTDLTLEALERYVDLKTSWRHQ